MRNKWTEGGQTASWMHYYTYRKAHALDMKRPRTFPGRETDARENPGCIPRVHRIVFMTSPLRPPPQSEYLPPRQSFLFTPKLRRPSSCDSDLKGK